MAILVCRYCKDKGKIMHLSYRSRKTYATVRCCGCGKEWVVGGFLGKLREDDVKQINEQQKLKAFSPKLHEHELEPQPTAMAIAIAKALGKEN